MTSVVSTSSGVGQKNSLGDFPHYKPLSEYLALHLVFSSETCCMEIRNCTNKLLLECVAVIFSKYSSDVRILHCAMKSTCQVAATLHYAVFLTWGPFLLSWGACSCVKYVKDSQCYMNRLLTLQNGDLTAVKILNPNLISLWKKCFHFSLTKQESLTSCCLFLFFNSCLFCTAPHFCV